MQTRLADIAQQAQVSTATVSRVLNGRPGVSGATRQSVLAALDMLGYERPASLTTKSVGMVGLVVPELTNPVFPAFVDAIEQRLSEERFTPLLCTQSPGGTSEDRYVEVLLDHAVNGIVFVSGLHADKQANLGRYQRLRNSGVPIVLVNGYNAEIDAPFVSTDDEAAIDASVDHLVALGHRRIAYLSGPRSSWSEGRRWAALSTGASRAGVTALRLGPFAPTLDGGPAAAEAGLASGATALLAYNDLLAIGVLRRLEERGVAVPGTVSVTGFDDVFGADFCHPPLTTVATPSEEAGRALVDVLLADRAPTDVPQRIVLPSALRVRASTGAPRTAR